MDTDTNTQANTKARKPALKPSLIVADLNSAYLRAVILAWEDKNTALMEYLGVSPALARKLSSAPSSALSRFGQFRSPLANFTGDEVMLERILDCVLGDIEGNRKVDELLSLGATFRHISTLTGIDYAQLRARSRALGITPIASRVPHLREDEHAIAEKAWPKFSHLNEIDYWIAMGRETGIPIRILHTTYRAYQLTTSRSGSAARV